MHTTKILSENFLTNTWLYGRVTEVQHYILSIRLLVLFLAVQMAILTSSPNCSLLQKKKTYNMKMLHDTYHMKQYKHDT